MRQQGARPQEVTWEDATKIFKAYPNAHLEDKVLNLAGGIVIPMEEGDCKYSSRVILYFLFLVFGLMPIQGHIVIICGCGEIE